MTSERPTKGAVRRRFRDDQLLRDLRRVARDLRRTHVTFALYSQHGRYSSYTLAERFGTWTLALERAGLARLYLHIGRRELMLNLRMLWRQLGRFPQTLEINSRTSAFSVNAHLRRFDTWGKLKTAFAEWMLSPEGQSDVRRFRAARRQWLRGQRSRLGRPRSARGGPRSAPGSAATAESASGAPARGQPIIDAASIGCCARWPPSLIFAGCASRRRGWRSDASEATPRAARRIAARGDSI